MNSYKRFTYIIFAVVLLVVLAGGIVRTTQSGMGCPDWPKCFGLWIPPISADELPYDFEKYLDKQDIDHSFNVYHTWIEYINRLLGAILGLLILIHFVWTVIKRKTVGKSILLISLLMLVTVGFTGWLGKVVVDENLAVVKITLHMFTALVLAILPIWLIVLLERRPFVLEKKTLIVIVAMVGLLIIQFLLGTNVREQIDQISKAKNYTGRALWLSEVDIVFFIHRSLSWFILGGAIYILLQKNKGTVQTIIRWIQLNVLVQFAIGVIFSYFDFPAFAQPIHLVGSFMLITLCIYSLLAHKYSS